MIKQTIKGAVAEYLNCVTALKSECSKELEVYFLNDIESFFISKNIKYLSEIQPSHAEALQAILLKS